MCTFDRNILEVPQHSGWHILSGSIVLMSGFLGTVWGVAWLVA